MSDWGLYPSPPEPAWECNECGHMFNIPGANWSPLRRLIGTPDDDQCPECGSRDTHRT